MARIRTIKPEFFTSEDIVSLSPLARLLYIATWCEADKAGRLHWKPGTFKLRYLPGDNCDVLALCQELIDSGLIVPYGNGLAWIPKFNRHQHINPRETESVLPDPSGRASLFEGSGQDPGEDSSDGFDGGDEGDDGGRVDDASERVPTRADASILELTHREEGKGRERKETPPTPRRGAVGRLRPVLGGVPQASGSRPGREGVATHQARRSAAGEHP